MEKFDEILSSLKKLKKVPLPSQEYWEKIKKMAVDEEAFFIAEEKRLLMTDDLFHRQFTI